MLDARSSSNGIIRKRPYKVMVSAITLVAFLFNIIASDFAWAARTPLELTSVGPNRADSPGLSSSAKASEDKLKGLNVGTFALPEYLGHIKDAWSSSSDPTIESSNHPTIIHIQDAHCNYAAQKRIAEIVEYLNRECGIDTINLEGGAKDYDLSIFTNIQDKAVREKVADNFVKEGLVSGAEYFAINNPDKVTLW